MRTLLSSAVETPWIGGLADPVHDAQRCFRATLAALSEPGRAVTLPVTTLPATAEIGLPPALAAMLLTLVDADTSVALLAPPTAVHWLRFHTGAVPAELDSADFVVAPTIAALPDLARLKTGSDDRPEHAATLIVGLDTFALGVEASASPLTEWRGPGIDSVRQLQLPLPASFWAQWQANHAAFPQGVDVLLSAADQVIGLPRSTQVRLLGTAVSNVTGEEA